MPHRSNPISYSADTCPPELARIARSGSSAELKRFQLDYSFDIWSYGMLLYELATGQSYFAGMYPGAVTRELASEDFAVDVSDVPDDRMRSLIQQCLNTNPKKRPSIVQVMLHPYFVTTGI